MSSTPAPLKIRRVKERCSASSSSLDHGLKLRGPSPRWQSLPGYLQFKTRQGYLYVLDQECGSLLQNRRAALRNLVSGHTSLTSDHKNPSQLVIYTLFAPDAVVQSLDYCE
ncbi:hypothetical protein TNCV_390831 [Trichonephila clavipes]|nr:hypothetical protein TNCV_390831 [Trichonephila clavipes]